MTPTVIIDGVEYQPAGTTTPRIGIGVTTHNRADALQKTLERLRRHTPHARIVIVDDASAQPVPDATHRFEQNVGIAIAKNKCLELLADCDHIFLFDDDTHPILDDWWRPYVESPEPHLMHVFRPGPQLYTDGTLTAFEGPQGCMLYVERRVLDVVGGMSPLFGRWGHEHVDWSTRIHNAGLTRWRFADIDSTGLFYAADAVNAVPRTIPRRERDAAMARNQSILESRAHSTEYVEYRTRDVVITVLLTGVPDPQRPKPMRPDVGLLKALTDSLDGAELVVLHDGLDASDTDSTTFVRVPATVNPYMQRWVSIRDYLLANPGIRHVVCCDGTDVVFQQPPHSYQPGGIVVGSEYDIVGKDWMRDNHPQLADAIDRHHDKPLLNAGLLAGNREDLLEFLHDLLAEWERRRCDVGLGDMALFNAVIWDRWANRVTYGPRVNTIFKANQPNGFSLIRHK